MMGDNRISFPADTDAPRVLDEAAARRVCKEIAGYCRPEGALRISVVSWWAGGQRWARNRASMTSDQRNVSVSIMRDVRGARGYAGTNQFDSASLKGAVNQVEYDVSRWARNHARDMQLEVPVWKPEGLPVWSDATFNRMPEDNGRAVANLTERATAAGVLSSGYIESFGSNVVQYARDQWGRISTQHARVTEAQCSVTVRNTQGTGSGWTGSSSFDFERIDLDKLTNSALEKCLKSIDTVRIEPGRYQVILEPQAVAAFAEILFSSLGRYSPEGEGDGPFFYTHDRSVNRFKAKLGMKVIDDRISVYHDPADPFVGTHPADGVEKTTFIRNGVLQALGNNYIHSINELSEQRFVAIRSSFRIDGTKTPLDDMIGTTKRGVLVTRLAQLQMLDGASLLHTGVTRDGLWLIENGRISKPVRNFRFTESPLFVFNNIEEIGESALVFSPSAGRERLASDFQYARTAIMVPALKVNDFNFTSTIDAV